MRWLTILGCAAGCGGDAIPLTHSGTPPTDTGVYPWPLWLYQSTVSSGEATFYAPDGSPAVRQQGFLWGPTFGGPTLVAELDHEVRFTVTNATGESLAFEWPGVEVLDSPTLAPGATGTLSFRTTRGPGVSLDRVPSEADRLARRGLFGLVTVRDPAQFPVEELDTQLNLLMLDSPPEDTEVDACRFDPTPPPSCPSWRPAVVGEASLLVAQRLVLNQAPLRHGGIPNEFQTVTVRSLEAVAGTDLRVNFASLSDTPHTLSLGGLVGRDPTGAEVTEVRLEPGQTTWWILQAAGPAGTYRLGCTEHDHRGVGEVVLTLRE